MGNETQNFGLKAPREEII